MVNLNCAGCNKTINGREDSKIESEDGKTTVYCSDECKKAPSFIRKSGTKGVCVKCSSEFDVKAPWQKFCSSNCRIKDHRYKKADVPIELSNNIVFEDMEILIRLDDEFISVEDVKYIDYTPSIIELCIELEEANKIMSKIGDCFFNLNISYGKFSEVIECCKIIDWKYRHEKSMHKLYATLLISQE